MLRDLGRWFADQARADGWFSSITGLGGRRDRAATMRIKAAPTLTTAEIDALYLYTGLGGRIVDAVPEDAIGTGVGTGDAALDRAMVSTGAATALGRAWRWGRAYGRGAVYLGLSDRFGPQSAPVSLDQIGPGDLAFVRDVDGVDLIPAEYEQARTSIRYGTPTHYYLTRTGQGARVHASRFVFFGGALTPERIRETESLFGRDLSVLQRPFEALRDDGASTAAVVGAFQDLSQAVFKIKDLTTMITNGGADAMRTRMEIVDLARSIARAVVIDADGEDFSHVGAANLTGVDALLGRLLQRVATASGIPATVLLGTAPIGMNATGESDLRIWYRRVEIERTEHAQHFARVIREDHYGDSGKP